jgi:putative FmdB family regulatory protein
MPIYEYNCPSCGTFEVTQRITDKPLGKCPTCKSKVKKLISNTSFQLKGTGWYLTDYARKGNGAKTDTKAENGGKAGTDAKSDTKGETKTESKSDSSRSTEKSSPPASSSTSA